MDNIAVLIGIVLGTLAFGGVAGYLTRRILSLRRIDAIEKKVANILTDAEKRHTEILLEAKEEAIKVRSNAEKENQERRSDLRHLERRITQKEENLDRKIESFERKESKLDAKDKELETIRAQVEEIKEEHLKKLESLAGMSAEEAKEFLLKQAESQMEDELARRYWELEQRKKEQADEKARKAIAVAIQRLQGDVVSEATTAVVSLPSDDMKGRIIGKEGRNIRALEKATGVDLIIDDTPEAVTLSTFDPVRREIARLAITKLISDGRIQPARIEDMVKKAKQEVEETVIAAGEEAVYELGITGFHPELIKLIGRLKYRYSYGQNILQHSIEVAHLSAVMAAEIGADVDISMKAGLLHDIGKALGHDLEGPHAEIGADIARKYNIRPEVVRAVEEHHDEDRVNVEAFIAAAADAISGGRPGARRDTVEHYIKRLEALERVANSFEGVEKSYAIQAGREIRIMVKPSEMDDAKAALLARDVVKKIEEELVYPGQIRVTVIRETRAVEVAK